MSAADMRREFDRAFAAKPEERARTADVLLVRAGDARHAIALAQVGELRADVPVVAVPTRDPRLLGVANVRGAIVPVYDLRAVLGGGRSTGTPRWLVVAARTPVALAFDALERHVRIPVIGEALPAVIDGSAVVEMDAIVEAIAKES